MTARAAAASPFGRFVAGAAAAGRLVVQPRMGFSDAHRMRAGLERTKFAAAATIGTVTLDSYTRVGDHAAARRALAQETPLNGYPLVAYPAAATRALLAGLHDESFPVQVRHGSSRPEPIIRAMAAAGLHATEGGPVSYCLPYGRTPLRESVRNWAHGCALLADLTDGTAHLETFGGCLLGQLCPPALLVAVSLLEALFFTRHGIGSVSLSYAQQTHPAQDLAAIRALRRLAAEFLPSYVDRHIVLYTYMGVFPASAQGALRLLEASADLAVRAGAERLIVKTTAEAHRIPTVEENVQALAAAADRADRACPDGDGQATPNTEDEFVYEQARTLIEAVLGLHPDVGSALLRAFRRGWLDVPFCLHPDNAGRSRSWIDDSGRLRWSDVGRMPLPNPARRRPAMTSQGLLSTLQTVASRYDRHQEATCSRQGN